MDESSGQNKRIILATVLCAVVLLGWNLLFPPARTPKAPGSPTQAVATATTGGMGMAQAVGSSETSTLAAESAHPAIEPSVFQFRGKVRADEHTVLPFALSVSNMGGGIDTFTLPTFKERDARNRATDREVSLADSTRALRGKHALDAQMGAIQFLSGTTFSTPALIPFEVVESASDHVRYRHVTREGVEIEREYNFREDSFEIEMAVTVRNRTEKVQSHKLEIFASLAVTDAMKQGTGFLAAFIPPPDHLELLCHADGEVKRRPFAKLLERGGSDTFQKSVAWVATDRQYFVSALVSRDRGDTECRLGAKEGIGHASLVVPEVALEPGREMRHKFTAYLGVKKPSLLTLANAGLEESVDYKILGLNLAPLCTALVWLLTLLHTWVNSWGLAILGLTVVVKLLLFPLNQRSGRSMRAMTRLRPEMDAIRKKFGSDRQRQGEEMMKLYKAHEVNPVGGCLPMLIQMPIWLALYRSLWASVDLYQQDFLWIHDLTTPDPYWILPVALVIVMFVQQKMTPTAMDPAQQKIMTYTMPLVFGAMMAALPAGLSFYSLVNMLLTIVQQHFINRSLGPIGGSAPAQGATA